MMLTFAAGRATASDLSYTFLDFQYIEQTVDASGTQRPVPQQTVNVVTSDGEGISVAGSLSIGDHFYVSGLFQSSIIGVEGVIESPGLVTVVDEDFDLMNSRVGFGYRLELGDNFDIVTELSYDSSEYDFGSFAGENFDSADSGVGASAGFRWNPTPPLELFAFASYSSVGKIDLDRLEFDSDSFFTVGARWYFFEDLGLSLEYRNGQAETFTLSMRFAFGTLPF